MTTAYTSLLGLALPVTGELSGTWGDTVNNSITSLLDSAIAGTQTLTADTTLTTTTGAANQSRQAILLCSPASANITITAPAQSKIYTVINTSATYTVTVRGVGPTTGVTIATSESAVIAWNGTDFIRISSNSTFTAPVVIEGTTTSAALRITQLGTGNALLVEDSTNPDASPFVIDASGRVISGHTSSLAIGSDTSNIQTNAGSSTNNGYATTNWTGSTGSSNFNFAKSRSTTVGTPSIVLSGDSLGKAKFYGDDGVGFIEAARIEAAVDGTPGTNDMPGRLVFFTTADGASTPTERMRINNAGEVGIGAASATGYSLYVAKAITGSTSAYGIASQGQIQSDVTSAPAYFRSSASTAATAFTVANLNHYVANQGTFGAGSAVTNQFGFIANSTLSGATNNYGFYGNLASASNTYNLYMSGTASNYLAGSLGIGSTTLTQFGLRMSKNITGNVNSYGVYTDSTVQSDVTTSAAMFATNPSTQATAFTLGALRHFQAVQGTIGATSAVTNQYGFFADSTLTGATNNYGFYGNIASGTGRYNLYMNGTAENFFGGNTIISVTDNTNAALRITQLGTGNALLVEDSTNPDSTPFVIDASGNVIAGYTASIATVNFSGGAITPLVQVQGVTGAPSAVGVSNWSATPASASSLVFSKSNSGTIGTRGAVASATNLGSVNFAGDDGTNFIASASISAAVDGTPGTNDMPGRLVFSTTADGASTPTERMRINSTGNLGLGSTSLANIAFRNSVNITGGTTSYGMFVDSEVQSGVTSNAVYYTTSAKTAAVSFTVSNLKHYSASQSSIGLGSTVTTQYGFIVEANLTGATNNYGFYGNIASGAGRYNFYAAGTADNYFAGNVGIGTSSPACALDVTGGIQTSRTAVTSPAASDGNVFSGTYTPTLTNTTNVAASTAYECQYMRVGNTVTVSGQVDIDPTLATTDTVLGMSLPIASALAANRQLGGTAANSTAGRYGEGVAITADLTNDRAQLLLRPSSTNNSSYGFSFTYRVL